MIAQSLAPSASRRAWPMTSEAWRALAADVRAATLESSRPHAARRLDTLRTVLGAAECVDDEGVVVIGRRATIREEDGSTVAYAIVFPGDGDPTMGWVSADSPLGAALLGSRAGDRVDVDAPAGRRTVEVVDVV